MDTTSPLSPQELEELARLWPQMEPQRIGILPDVMAHCRQHEALIGSDKCRDFLQRVREWIAKHGGKAATAPHRLHTAPSQTWRYTPPVAPHAAPQWPSPALTQEETRQVRRVRERHEKKLPDPPTGMSVIELTDGGLSTWVDKAEGALVEHDRAIYQYGDFLARTAPGPITTADEAERVALRVVRISHQHLTERLTRVALFMLWDGRKGDWKAIVPPASIAQAYLERIGQWNLPALLGIASAPVFRRDGSILDKPGYDPVTCLFYDPRGVRFDPVTISPSREDAMAAINYVASVYAEIPFVDQPSLSVALSANLCAVAPFAIRGIPLHAFTATAAGSGKSMLADCTSIIATGAEAPAISIGSDGEELKKSLGAELSSGAPVVNLDNCEYPVGGELINQVLTQERVKVRILGLSRMVEIPRGALMMANGNGLVIVGDLVRRTIMAKLDSQSETPWTRTFRTVKPTDRAHRERGKLVNALLTVLRAYHVAGYPHHGQAPLGGFEDWDHLIRGALLWCGCADPVRTMEHLRVADPKRASLAGVLHRWFDVFQSEELTVGEVIKRATDREPRAPTDFNRSSDFMFPELREALLDAAGDHGAINSRALGKWLRKNAGSIADGLRIEAGRIRDGYQHWIVRKVS